MVWKLWIFFPSVNHSVHVFYIMVIIYISWFWKIPYCVKCMICKDIACIFFWETTFVLDDIFWCKSTFKRNEAITRYLVFIFVTCYSICHLFKETQDWKMNVLFNQWLSLHTMLPKLWLLHLFSSAFLKKKKWFIFADRKGINYLFF